MDTIDCTQARSLLSGHQDGTLDPAAEAAVAAHLRGCAECSGAAGSLLAVRELLRGLPREPAPPELLGRVLAAVRAEERDRLVASAPAGTGMTRPFLSRFRIPLEAAAAVLLFASLYWYQQATTPGTRPPPAPAPGVPAETGKPSPPRTAAAKKDPVKARPSGNRLPRGNPAAAGEEAPPAPKPRTWTAADLPTVPALRASSDSARIVPFVPSPPPEGDPASAEGGGDPFPPRVFAAPPSRLLRPLPYGRDVVVEVKPESSEGAEERIAGAAFRHGGIVERIERESGSTGGGAAGTVRVVLPEAGAGGFLDELRRIGTVAPPSPPTAGGFPAGPRPGTVAYAVRIRVR